MAPWFSMLSVLGVSVGAASNNKVGSIVTQAEKMLAQLKHGLKETPGVRDKVGELELSLEGVLPLIMNGHTETQDAIDSAIVTMQQNTLTAQGLQTDAAARDTAWYTCVMEEVNILKQKEAAEEQAATLLSQRDTACSQANNTRTSSHALPSALALFACDMSSDSNACTEAFQKRNIAFEDELANLESLVSGDVAVWNAHINECGRLSQEHRDKLADIAGLVQRFVDQDALCKAKNEERIEAVCAFGSAFATTCSSLDAYNDLVDRTAVVGGDQFSAPDRQEEYATVKTAVCKLENYLDGTANTCSGFVFPQVLDFKTESVPQVYTCSETSFTFDGRTWSEPDNSAPRSAEYTSSEFSFQYNGKFEECA